MLTFDLQRFAGEKTERMTPHRRRELRRKGQIPKSSELTSALVLVTLIVVLKILATGIWGGLENAMRADFTNAAAKPLTQMSLVSLMDKQVWFLVGLLAPVLGAALGVGLLVAFAQVGPLFLPNRLTPDFNRVQPLAGLKRMFSVRTGIETLKSILKLTVIVLMCYITIQGTVAKLNSLASTDIVSIPPMVGGVVFQLAMEIASLMLGLAFLDFLYQRFDFERTNRMSKQEIKEEMKQYEGNPLVKSKIRQRGRELAMRRMMQDVPKADVVITNPTHFAVALRYDGSKMRAPVVVAKGQDEVAQKIKSVASTVNVPMVENKPLARSLYRTVEIGEPIPNDLFQAVAEVLAYVYRLKNQRVGG